MTCTKVNRNNLENIFWEKRFEVVPRDKHNPRCLEMTPQGSLDVRCPILSLTSSLHPINETPLMEERVLHLMDPQGMLGGILLDNRCPLKCEVRGYV